ncbi:MAG: hypothetical protein ACI9LM_004422 [Alteromonadaceae bacterium]|jgi:hypothetical protein
MEVFGLKIDVVQALSSAIGTIFAAFVTLLFIFATKKLSKLGDIAANFKDRNKLKEIENAKSEGKIDGEHNAISKSLDIAKIKAIGERSVAYEYHNRKEDLKKLELFTAKVDELTVLCKAQSDNDANINGDNIQNSATDILRLSSEIRALFEVNLRVYNCDDFESNYIEWINFCIVSSLIDHDNYIDRMIKEEKPNDMERIFKEYNAMNNRLNHDIQKTYNELRNSFYEISNKIRQ